MIKIGKPISKTLLMRTFDWKRKVQSQNRIHSLRMIERDNHYSVLNCLLCGSKTSPYLEVDNVIYGKCEDCIYVQSSIRPSLDFIKTLYGSECDDYSSQDLAYVNIDQSTLEARVEEIAMPKVEWVSNSIEFEVGDLWLDVGSGTGDALAAAGKFGFSVLGIEISPTELSLAASRAIPTISMFYDGTQEIPQMKNAKVISIFNVLEHTLFPLEFLLSISKQMASGSYLVIEVPRLNGFSSIIQKSGPRNIYRHIFSPEHLNIFSDKSMDYCLEKISMERMATWFFGSDAIEIFGHVINLVNPDSSDGLEDFSQEINLLQQQIDENGLSDVMLLIARKK